MFCQFTVCTVGFGWVPSDLRVGYGRPITLVQIYYQLPALPREPLMFCLDYVILCIQVINVLSIYSMYSMVTRLQWHWCYVAPPREPLMFCLDSVIPCVPVINVQKSSRKINIARTWSPLTPEMIWGIQVCMYFNPIFLLFLILVLRFCQQWIFVRLYSILCWTW